MDVDLLRPGTVPISPDTSLWFEFLLDPDLLEKHLKNPVADPTPTELLTKFVTLSVDVSPDQSKTETNGLSGYKPKLSRRSQALKILALRIAAHLRWDLELFENKLSISIQATILKDFLNLFGPDLDDISSHTSIDFSQLEPPALFAIFLYHRWVLRTFESSMLNGKSKQSNALPNEATSCEDISEAASERSVELLKIMSVVEIKSNVIIPSLSCFTCLTEHLTDVDHNWSLGNEMSLNQFHCQVFMDITSYLMFRESYREACEMLKHCCTAFNEWKAEVITNDPYCTVTSDTIAGLCMAVGIPTSQHMPTLVQQFHRLLSEQYMSIERVLDMDNLVKEIPPLYRDSIELDITSEIASGKITVYRDALVQIQASNMVRRALEGGSWQTPKVTPPALQKALIPVIPKCNQIELNSLRYLIGSTLVNGSFQMCRELIELPITSQLLTPEEINSAVESDYSDPMPQVLNTDLESNLSLVSKYNSASLNKAAIERVLMASYDPSDISAAIVKLISISPSINMSKLNRSWDIPASLYNAISSIGGDFLPHYLYVLLAKAYELDKIKNYSQARSLMRTAMSEVTRENPGLPIPIINQLINWELLLIDIHEFHNEWPAKHLDWNSLTQNCLSVLHKVNGSLPRITLRDECSLALLNTGQWQALVAAPQIKHSAILADLYTAIAAACEDMNKYNKKIPTDAWDKILEMMAPNNQKRRDSPNGVAQALCGIIELNALVIVVSLLAKLHNVLIDQPALDLYTQLTQVWPSSIKSANQYSLNYVSDVLMKILEHALRYYPGNVQWLKLLGDLHFVKGHHSAALKSYIEAVIASTDYFTRPLHKTLIEDNVYKRMIKSCTMLQCHTQAGILCQFLDEIDYSTAFKSLSEGACSDSMDSYYNCIWDVNMLEYLINLHTKRGEHHRKQKVIRTIGLLELNSNNNDEIKREAENIRKGRFMRAMAAQFLP